MLKGWEEKVVGFCLRRNQDGGTKSCFTEADTNFASEFDSTKICFFVSVIWEGRLLKLKGDKGYSQMNNVVSTNLILLVTL